ERVPVERLRRHRAPTVVEILRGRDAAELVAEVAQDTDELTAGREPPWNKPRGTLGLVPAAEVLDHRLRVDGRLRIRRELAHRRRAPQPIRARPELLENLLVGVALADARL